MSRVIAGGVDLVANAAMAAMDAIAAGESPSDAPPDHAWVRGFDCPGQPAREADA